MSEGRTEQMELSQRLRVIVPWDAVLFPGVTTQLLVRGEGLRPLLEDAIQGKQGVLFVAARERQENPAATGDLYRVGVTAVIKAASPVVDGGYRLLVDAHARVRIDELQSGDTGPMAAVRPFPVKERGDAEEIALTRNLSRQFQRLVELSPRLSADLAAAVRNMEGHPMRLASFIAIGLDVDKDEKQRLLEMESTRGRLERLTILLNRELTVVEAGNRIQSRVMDEVGQVQRQHFLREQMRVIRQELGDDDVTELEELREQIEAAGLSEEARWEAVRELDRLAQLNPGAAEYTTVRTYLDWLVNLPWSKASRERADLNRARRILDEDHEGLEPVKERTLEYLAVRQLKPDSRGPILCFVGPPGVGKTSLGQSIARALGRKFARISLGGVHDETEIRGHRRTYIGSLPGRIVQTLRKVGTNNPVIVLDEIDKVGADYRGDPAAALLEVLDPEQNSSFVDHYLDVAFDLSGVAFVATANSLDTIPPALRDRLEIIKISGYTEEEKVRIVQSHLLPRQKRQHGISRRRVRLEPDAIRAIINEYTREAGVRGLEREISRITRKIARRVVEGGRGTFEIGCDQLRELLGLPKVPGRPVAVAGVPGVVSGLAWTPVGGEVMLVEATMMPGNGTLTLTGKLGEVMRESAQIAHSYIRAHADCWQLDGGFFERYDLHIHLPAGATPKDGPSAGVTLLTALVSLLTGQAVRDGLAMTGEVTLRGAVMPVGGIVEKVLAAHREGLTKVLLPRRNERDLDELPPEVRNVMEFYPVDDLSDVLAICLDERAVRHAA